jgi:hypothetical protein
MNRRWRRVPLEPEIEQLLTAERAEADDWINLRDSTASKEAVRMAQA